MSLLKMLTRKKMTSFWLVAGHRLAVHSAGRRSNLFSIYRIYLVTNLQATASLLIWIKLFHLLTLNYVANVNKI